MYKKVKTTAKKLHIPTYRLWLQEHAKNGAMIEFIGSVKQSENIADFIALHIFAHQPMTQVSVESIVDQWIMDNKQQDIHCIIVVHAYGELTLGQDIVYVAISSNSRTSAFSGCSAIVEKLKTKAIFWKKEIGTQSSHWIAPPSI